MPKKANYAKLFTAYLMAVDPGDETTGELKLDCPFDDCLKEEHFYGNCETGQWHCKRCDRSGNARTLLTELHQQFLKEDAPYEELAELRGLQPETFENACWAYDYTHERWLVPYYTYEHKDGDWRETLNNLGYFFWKSSNPKSRFVIRKAGGLPFYLYNSGLHAAPHDSTAVITEGEWDALAYTEIFPDCEHLILGKPGAGFNKRYLDTLEHVENIHLLLDNDEGGRKQTAKVLDVCAKAKSGHTFYQLDWTLMENPPKDIRDLLTDEGAETAADLITQSLVEAESPDIEADEKVIKTAGYATDINIYQPIESFPRYISEVEKLLYLTEETKRSMAACLAITASIPIPGEPLWAFLIGPPSSGKTTFIESFGGSNQAFDNLSKLTAKSLVSGWKDETGDDPSYLRRLRGKTLFVKDFTTTLQESREDQRELFGLLTDAYDGYVKIAFGNNTLAEFDDTYFNMIAGVTDIVHRHSAATLGERFLRIDWLGKHYDPRRFAKAALANFGQKSKQKDRMTELTLGFFNFIKELPVNLEIPHEYHDPIIEMAEFISLVRTKIEVDRHQGLIYRPRPELPSRLATQLAKLFVGSRMVYYCGDSEEQIMQASAEAFKVLKKITLDTCYGFSLDILRFVANNPGADRETICGALKAGVNGQKRAHAVLNEMLTTEVIRRTTSVPSGRGRPRDNYEIDPRIKLSFLKDSDHAAKNGKGRLRTKANSSPSRPSKRRAPSKGRRGTVR